MRRFVSCCLPLWTTGLLVLSGCGSDRLPTYPVAGRVVFADGEPVRTGTVELESLTHGVTAAGRIQPDGSFVLGTYDSDDGAVTGEHRAIVVQIVTNDGTVTHVIDHGRPVDSRFASYESAQLTATIEPAESNEIELVVTRAPRRNR